MKDFDTLFNKYLQQKIQQHYSIKHVAEMFDISGKTIRNWLYTGKIHGHKIGGAVRIPESELCKIVNDWRD